MSSPILEERKDEEKLWYEKRYSAKRGLDSVAVRNSILVASEEYFKAQLGARAIAGTRILEIGCGEGELAIELARKGAHVTGIDISEVAVATAKENARKAGVGPAAEFMVADVEALRFEDNYFDIIVDREVLSSVLLSSALNECKRTLRPGGVFLAMECFGHNPLFNLNRWVKARRGERTTWASNHILTEKGLLEIERRFSKVRVSYFHLVSAVFGLPALVMPSAIATLYINILDDIDGIIFKNRCMKKFAFKVVIEAVKNEAA